jgi:hypothetical protein
MVEDNPWERHIFLDGLYRFYLDLIIKFHSFYLPVVGAVTVYVLDDPTPVRVLGLVIPLILSVGAAIILFSAIKEAKELIEAIRISASTLNIISTHAQILVRAVIAFFVLHVVLALALGALIGIVLLKGPRC